MGIRAIYTDPNSHKEMPVEVYNTTHQGNPIMEFRVGDLQYLTGEVGGWDCLMFPPHKTPADWQPEPCSCPLCLEDHAPDCATQNCNNVPTPECTCGLVEE